MPSVRKSGKQVSWTDWNARTIGRSRGAQWCAGEPAKAK